MKKLKYNKTNVSIGILLLIYLVLFPVFFRNANYLLNIVITSSVLSIISLGVWITFSIGRINIGQGAFAGIGGYTVAILMMRYGVSFWLALPLAAVVGIFFAILIGYPLLRIKGFYFAMVTLSLTELFRLIFLNAASITRGGNGIMGIPRPGELSIFGLTIIPAMGRNYVAFYYLVAVILVLVFFGAWRLYKSRIGWIFKAMRQSEELALSAGINVVKYRVIAYSIASALGAIGGGIFIVFYGNIFPDSFRVMDSTYFMLYCFLGGLAYLPAPLVGAFLLTGLFESLRHIQEYQEGIYAVIFVIILLWLPNGLLSLKLKDVKKIFTRKQNKIESNESSV